MITKSRKLVPVFLFAIALSPLVGGYFQESNSATYRGQKHKDIPIDSLFSDDPSAVPVARWAPGLLTNSRILSYGGFAEYDLRNNSRGLTKGAYFYGRIGSAQGLKDKTAFSDYGWLEAELDARGLHTAGKRQDFAGIARVRKSERSEGR